MHSPRVASAPRSPIALGALVLVAAAGALLWSGRAKLAAALVVYALWLGTLAARGRRAGPWPWLGAAGLQLLWLVPPTGLPGTLGGSPAARLLLNPTFYAGVAVMALAWRWGGRVAAEPGARP